MKRLELTDDLLTGIKEIDNQHRQLFAKVNTLLFPETGKLWSNEINDGMEFLVQYVDKHFSTEEELMEFYGYPKRDGHKKQHARLRREVEELYGKMKEAKSRMSFAGELHFLLSDWYIYHIRHWDKGYATFLQGRVELDSIILDRFESIDDDEIKIIKIGD